MAGSSAVAGSSGPGGGSTTVVPSSASGGTSTGTTTQTGGGAKGGGGATTGGATGGTATGTGGAATGGRSGADAGVDRDAGSVAGGTGGRSNPDASPSTGGSGGSTGAGPCKASPCVILPLGDSITHGFGSSDDAGYRSGLFKLAVEANQNITFIGSLSNGNVPAVSGKTFPKNHEGHDGFKVTQINDYVPPKKAFSTTPHIVLLHAGTNDMTSNADPTTTANQLKTLVGNIVAAAPDALVVVAKIVPLGYNNSNYTSYIAKIPDVVKSYADKGQNVIMVEMSTLPSSDIKGNGDVHPTAKGYSDMADLWYKAIKGYLPN
jgi:lysophospholipase L1-like esterase